MWFSIMILVYDLQDGENLTREQLENEIQKLKKEHADDEGIYLPYFIFFFPG